jgi:quinol monooxygenase YgiN
MSEHILLISEWLPKENCEQRLLEAFQDLARKTLDDEKGCVQFNVSKQLLHSKTTAPRDFKIMLMQEYESVEDFEKHCEAPYVVEAFEVLLENKGTALIDNYECRIFSKVA